MVIDNGKIPESGLVSADTYFTDGNVHLVSNYWGLNSFLDVAQADRSLRLAHVITATKPYIELGIPARFLDSERAWVKQQDADGKIESTEVCLADTNRGKIEDILSQADVIFMGGGNTPYLLQQLQDTGTEDMIRELVKGGTWYLGKSAGAIVAGPDINPRGFFLPSMATREITDTAGLGLTDVYPFPHVDTPHLMRDVDVEGKNGWEHAIELPLDHPVAYVFDNKALTGVLQVAQPAPQDV